MQNIEQIKESLIKSGISNLKIFGYSNVDKNNILTDIIYNSMFKSMLLEHKGVSKSIDEAISQLLSEIDLKNELK